MSDVFHKGIYTGRCPGYKYRTLSTNTGEKRRRDSVEDNAFERKLKELKKAINSRIQNEIDKVADARDAIREKFNKVDKKIDTLIELQKTVLGLREDLSQAQDMLVKMMEKVNKIEIVMNSSDPCSLYSRKSSYRSPQPTILEEKEIFQSNITRI